jgi:hypothetical protein
MAAAIQRASSCEGRSGGALAFHEGGRNIKKQRRKLKT